MILTKNIENLKSKDKLKIKCDYCTNIFERNKSEVIRGKKIIQKDACSEKTCINKKRKDGFLKLNKTLV